MVDYRVSIGGQDLSVRLAPDGQISVNGQSAPIEIVRIDEHEYLVRHGLRHHRVAVLPGKGAYAVSFDGHTLEVVVETERERLIREHAREGIAEHARAEIHAPMPAMVVRIEVAEGDRVSAGQGLIVLEAMKMENEIRAPRDATVRSIQARTGSPVEKGALLMLLE